MKTLRIILLAFIVSGGLASCTSTKEVPNPEVMHTPDTVTPTDAANGTAAAAE